MAVVGTLGLYTSASARDGMIIVNLPWAKPASDARSATVYMALTSTVDAALIDARSDIATSAALTGPRNSEAAAAKAPAKMNKLSLRANETLTLAPGGYCIALRRLSHPMRIGDRVPLTLTIEYPDGSRQDVPVTAEARMHSPLDDERRAHHAH